MRGRARVDCIGRMVMRPSDREIASQFSALLDRHFHFADVGITEAFIDSSKIILNGIANVLHRFLLGFSLRPTTGKRGAIHRVTFFRLMKHDLISEAHRRTLYRERHKLQRTLCRPNLAGSLSFNIGECSTWSLPAVEGNTASQGTLPPPVTLSCHAITQCRRKPQRMERPG